MISELVLKAQNWAQHDPDRNTKNKIERLIKDNNWGELRPLFEGALKFGTAGLRAEMDAGESRMNRAVVIRATYGLCQYLFEKYPNKNPKLVVGNDARHMSNQFAQDVCAVAFSLGVEVFQLPSEIPTPILAFSVRHIKADAGVMITASHNPAMDNGYKVFDHLGAGIIPPMDKEIEEFMTSAPHADQIKLTSGWNKVDLTSQYQKRVAEIACNTFGQINVAYTPMHGVGQNTFDACMKAAGFNPSTNVASQAKPDPNFPTLLFPNPEEPGSLDLLINLAQEIEADIAIANDPDADRCAVVIPENQRWKILTGDELGFLIAWWLFKSAELKNLSLKGLMVSSVVSSSLIPKMAKANGLKSTTTLSGVKWMGHLEDLVFGYEEAYGYCTDPEFVRDKDGISTALRIVELFSYLKQNKISVREILNGIYDLLGVHLTQQLSFRLASAIEAKNIIKKIILNPPPNLGRFIVETVENMNDGIDGLPAATGLRLFTKSARVLVRPSGTEPKLKCYIEVSTPPGNPEKNLIIAREELDLLTSFVSKLVKRYSEVSI